MHELMSRAARERGLEVEIVRDQHLVVVTDRERVVGFLHKMVSSLVPQPLAPVSRSKELTSRLLDTAGVAVPRSRAFGPDQVAEGVDHAVSLGRAVVKPRGGRGGRGVTVDLTEESDIRTAWGAAQEHDPHDTVVVEEHVVGLDVRAFVVGSRVVGLSARMPQYVVGNGRDSIRTLAGRHQDVRQRHAAYRKADFPRVFGTDPERVPRGGEFVLLGSRATPAGSETVEVLGTGVLHPSHQEVAVKAGAALGTRMCGVDLLVPDPSRPGGAVVNEVNTSPNPALHVFPCYGSPSDTVGGIVDEMLAEAREAGRLPRPRRTLGRLRRRSARGRDRVLSRR